MSRRHGRGRREGRVKRALKSTRRGNAVLVTRLIRGIRSMSASPRKNPPRIRAGERAWRRGGDGGFESLAAPEPAVWASCRVEVCTESALVVVIRLHQPLISGIATEGFQLGQSATLSPFHHFHQFHVKSMKVMKW